MFAHRESIFVDLYLVPKTVSNSTSSRAQLRLQYITSLRDRTFAQDIRSATYCHDWRESHLELNLQLPIDAHNLCITHRDTTILIRRRRVVPTKFLFYTGIQPHHTMWYNIQLINQLLPTHTVRQASLTPSSPSHAWRHRLEVVLCLGRLKHL